MYDLKAVSTVRRSMPSNGWTDPGNMHHTRHSYRDHRHHPSDILVKNISILLPDVHTGHEEKGNQNEQLNHHLGNLLLMNLLKAKAGEHSGLFDQLCLLRVSKVHISVSARIPLVRIGLSLLGAYIAISLMGVVSFTRKVALREELLFNAANDDHAGHEADGNQNE
ncbi:hypothetical protein HF072_05415 [Bacillus sp. RO3]|nr:hypothetical protein [Bacillus sp. RO3]